MANKGNNRAGIQHWTEYIHFLKQYPCMLTDQNENNDLWGILSSRLNGVNACKKVREKWEESIKNWRRGAIRKYENGENLNECEKALITMIKDPNPKQRPTVDVKAIDNNSRAGKGHWNEYVNFLDKNPSMVQNKKGNDKLWCVLRDRLNRIDGCKKSKEKWIESIQNWERYTIKKYEDYENLNDTEVRLIKLIYAQPKQNVIEKNAKLLAKCIWIEAENLFGNPHNQISNLDGARKCVNNNDTRQYELCKLKPPIKPNYERNVLFDEDAFAIQPIAGAVLPRHQKRLLQPLKIYYQNVRGLRTKLEKFSGAVLLKNYDVIILTETWLLPAIGSHRVFDDRYVVFRTDRSRATSEKMDGGGVLIAVLKTCGFIKRHLTSGAVEEVWVTLVKYDLVIGAVYFPPRTPGCKFREFLQSANVVNGNRKSIIVGDFNMRRVTWIKQVRNLCTPMDVTVESFKTLLDGLKLLGVYQRNNIVNATGVILDLVYTNTDTVNIMKTDSPFVSPDYHHPPLKILLSLNERNPTGG